MTVPLYAPTTIISGDTYKFTRTYGPYPAGDGWQAVYWLVGPSNTTRMISGSASGNDHSFTISAIKTSGLAVGTYEWSVKCSKAGEVYTAESGMVPVTANLSTLTERIQFAESMITAIETALQNMLADGLAVTSLSVAGRSYSHMSMKDLQDMRAHYQYELDVLKRGGGINAVVRPIPLRIGSLY